MRPGPRAAALAWALSLTVPMMATEVRAASPADDPIDLTWRGPPECPGKEAVLAQIRRVLGDSAPPRGGPPPSAEAWVTRGDAGVWHARIVTAAELGGERTLDAKSCAALTSAAALVLAIRVRRARLGDDRGVPPPPVVVPPPPAPSPPPPMPPSGPVADVPRAEPLPAAPAYAPTHPPTPLSSSSPAAWGAPLRRGPGSLVGGASILGSAGDLPHATATGELTLGYARGPARLELHAETGLVETVHATLPGATVTLRGAGGGARGCYDPRLGRVSVFGCADAELDAMWGDGQGFPTRSFASSGRWLSLGAVAGARYRVTDRFGLRASVEAIAPLRRPEFVEETYLGVPDGVVHTPSAAWGRGGIGIEAIFF